MKQETFSDRVLKHIYTRTHEEFRELSVNRLAEFFAVDRFKLSRTFKEEKGMTLERFLNKERMFRCASLLVSEEVLTIKEVADILGFCNCDYFIKKFKEYYGMLPSQYKEFKTHRSGKDRRKGPKERRKNSKELLPPEGERRKEPGDRRKGPRDRRF